VNSADTTLLLANTAGPFLVTSHGGGEPINAGARETVTWDVAGTDAAPVNVSSVRISMSADGGRTYSYVLAASTANDGSQAVTIPPVAVDAARFKVEALGNVFFDLSNADVHVKGAAEQLDDLLEVVTGLGTGTSLADKVRSVIANVNAGNLAGACDTLTHSFPNQVRALTGKKLTPTQAARLLTDAARIAFVLGC
jgi:hypothetical protein